MIPSHVLVKRLVEVTFVLTVAAMAALAWMRVR
jgi:hypothetical protein